MSLCNDLAIGKQADAVKLGLCTVAQDLDRAGKWQIWDLAKNIELEAGDREPLVEFRIFGARCQQAAGRPAGDPFGAVPGAARQFGREKIITISNEICIGCKVEPCMG